MSPSAVASYDDEVDSSRPERRVRYSFYVPDLNPWRKESGNARRRPMARWLSQIKPTGVAGPAPAEMLGPA
ncbi:MAG: hypothetical protein O7B26_06460, partial [Planctomycetota bacterium]|nr:hypothetical protein [Planctomycetota bacterium]